MGVGDLTLPPAGAIELRPDVASPPPAPAPAVPTPAVPAAPALPADAIGVVQHLLGGVAEAGEPVDARTVFGPRDTGGTVMAANASPSAAPIDLTTDTNAEQRVATRIASDPGDSTDVNLATGLQGTDARRAFIQRCSQVDGNAATRTDQAACGVAAVVDGMIAASPASLQEMAQILKHNPDAARLFPGLDPWLLDKIASGNASPADVRALIRGLYNAYHSAMSNPHAGMSANDLIDFVGRLRDLGVTIPDIQLVQTGPGDDPNAGHWMVMVPSQNMAINTWPDASGRAEIMTPASKAYDRCGTVGMGWSARETLSISGGGSSVNRQMWSAPNGAWLNPKKGQPIASVSYTLNRTNHQMTPGSLQKPAYTDTPDVAAAQSKISLPPAISWRQHLGQG